MAELCVCIKNLIAASLKNFDLRKIFNLANLIKLLAIYLFGILCVIVIYFEFSDNFWRKLLFGELSKQRISFYTVDRIGEKMIYDRLKIVAASKNIDYCGVNFYEALSHFWLTKHFFYVTSSLINYLYNPQFNFAVTHHVNILPWGYNITYLNMPRNTLYSYSLNGDFDPQWRHLDNYDAYADLYSFVHESNDLLDIAISKQNQPNKKIIPIYISQNHLEYSAPVSFDQAVINGSLWGCSRGSLRTMRALKKLAEEGLLVAYGMREYLSFMNEAYKGPIEKFGDSVENIIAVQKKHGIALVIHNLEHMLEAIPTSRISEAAASGALVISDHHPFIEKLFGDNVLYFNSLADHEHIYNEIKTHIEWARNNPELAKAKAHAAYKIFAQNLTIEKQLDTLINAIGK